MAHGIDFGEGWDGMGWDGMGWDGMGLDDTHKHKHKHILEGTCSSFLSRGGPLALMARVSKTKRSATKCQNILIYFCSDDTYPYHWISRSAVRTPTLAESSMSTSTSISTDAFPFALPFPFPLFGGVTCGVNGTEPIAFSIAT